MQGDIIRLDKVPKYIIAKVEVRLMRNEIKKKNRVTEIYFNEQDSVMYGKTYNTKFKKQLRKLARDYPEQCKISVDPDTDMIEFEINKDRLTFRINNRISDERRAELVQQAKEIDPLHIGKPA